MILLLSLLLYEKSNFLHLSSFALSSNLTIFSKKSLSFKYISHPLILGIEHFSNPTITLKSILFKGSNSPLFYGKSVNLNLYDDQFLHFYNEIIQYQDKFYSYPKLYFEKCTVTIESCIFMNQDELRGAIENTNSSLVCRYSSFEYCYSSDGIVYGNSSNLDFFSTNFSFCMAENAGSVALFRSEGHFKNCIFNNNMAINFSAISVFQESIFLTKCYFINNRADKFACVYLNKASGVIRSCEFYKNSCDSFDTLTAVVFLSNPRDISIIDCKFSDNLKNYYIESDSSIFVDGNSGLAKIRFCTFDNSVKDSIIKQNSKDLTVLITNCQQDLNMDLYSKSIEDTIIKFSKSYNVNFSANLSLFFCIISIFGTISIFVSVIAIFSCIGIHLF